jgi:histone-lysine N-methyltransferase SETD2
LVDSDFKHGRVEDIFHISEKQQQKIKKYCKEYFEKAVEKHKAHAKKKAENNHHRNGGGNSQSASQTPQGPRGSGSPNERNGAYNESEDDGEDLESKRKRDDDDEEEEQEEEEVHIENGRHASPAKRHKSTPPPLPPSQPHRPHDGLDDELQRSGLSASHHSIGVVQ